MAKLYRDTSIEKLSDPEQLDRAITITSPMSWLVLVGVLLVCIAVVLWSFFGSIPTTESVDGMIVSKSNVIAVYTDQSGVISQILKHPGDRVMRNDVIAKARTSDKEEFDIIADIDGTLSAVVIKEETQIFTGNEVARLTPDYPEDKVIICYAPISTGEKLNPDMVVSVYPTFVDPQQYGHMEATIESVGKYAASTKNMQYVIGSDNMVSDRFLSEGPVLEIVCRITSDDTSSNSYYWTNNSGKDQSIPIGAFVSVKAVTKQEAPISKVFHW